MAARVPAAEPLIVGAVAGLVGGLVAAIFMTAVAVSSGSDAWVAAKVAGTSFLGSRALQPGFDAGAVLAGILGHLAVSAIWGALFGVLAATLPAPATMAAGVLWGMIVWLAMYYVVLPALGIAYVVSDTPLAVAAGQHVVFGVAVALTFVGLRRRLGSSIEPHVGPGTPTPHPA
jgi:hypothetical protein